MPNGLRNATFSYTKSGPSSSAIQAKYLHMLNTSLRVRMSALNAKNIVNWSKDTPRR
jgi:hypothetical protein